MASLSMLLAFGQLLQAQAPGDALRFDGTDAYVEIPDDPSLDGMDSLTLSMWVYFDALSDSRGLIEKGDWGDAYKAHVDANGDVLFGKSTSDRVTGNGLVNSGEWLHLAFRFDGSQWEIFVNGSLKASASSNATSIQTNSKPLRIGKNNQTSNDSTHAGVIDQTRVWSEARTAGEIQDNIYLEIEPDSFTNLEGYWRFNKVSSSTAFDETDNGNDGTLINSPKVVGSGAIMTSNADLVPGGTYSNDLRGIYASKTSDSSGGQKVTEGSSSIDSADGGLFGHNGGTGQNTSPDQINYKAGSNYTGDTAVEAVATRNWKIQRKGNATNLTFTYNTKKSSVGGLNSSNANKDDYCLIQISTSGKDILIQTASAINKNKNIIRFNGVDPNATYTFGTTDKTNSPLPVELKHFDVSQKGYGTKLSWATASETQNRQFVIQRKTEQSKHWHKRGVVQGHGTSYERHDYQYRDQGLENGKYYYRLKQVDFDGSFEIHPVEVVVINGGLTKNAKTLELNVGPNPVNEQIQLNLYVPKTGNYRLTIRNPMGEVVQQYNRYFDKGQHQFNIPFSQYQAGIYLLQITSSNGAVTEKILKAE